MLWKGFMNKKEAEEMTNDVLLAESLLKLKSLEKLLISKGVFTQEEFDKEMSVSVKNIAKSILQKANVSGDLDSLISDTFNKNS